MATGLKVPVGTNRSGGAAIESSSREQQKKILSLDLAEGGDDNPFQSLGLPSDLAFKIKDAAFQGESLRAVQRVLARHAARLQLSPDKPISFDETIEGEVELNFKYIDLEFNTVEEFATTFAR